MKIAQINTGSIQDPINAVHDGWGAIEKIICFYTKELRKLGHEVDIKYPMDKLDDYDIVHAHVANQAVMLKEKGIPYIFTCDDHHVLTLGEDSNVYKENLDAMQSAVQGIVGSEDMITTFPVDGVKYVSHGVDSDYFTPNYSKFNSEKKLLCVGNNHLWDASGNPIFDRKGFSYAIKAAEKLNLPITVCGPYRFNEDYFEANPELLDYSKLNLIYDASDAEVLDLYRTHDILVHATFVEAGHPPLTVLEAMSCGMPVVGTPMGDEVIPKELEVHGAYPWGADVRNHQEVNLKINNAIKDFEKYSREARNRVLRNHTWQIIVHDMELIYNEVSNPTVSQPETELSTRIKNPKVTVDERGVLVITDDSNTHSEDLKTDDSMGVDNADISWDGKLLDLYDRASPLNRKINEDIKEEVLVSIDFDWGVKVSLGLAESLGNEEYTVKFGDGLQNIYTVDLKQGMYAQPTPKWHVSWDIDVEDKITGANVVNYKYNLENQLVDIICDSSSLGDTIAWVPYVEEFRKKHNCTINFLSWWSGLFIGTYPEINFHHPEHYSSIENKDDPYSRIHVGWYYDETGQFRMDIHKNDPRTIPLQQTSSDIFGLEHKEIRAIINVPEPDGEFDFPLKRPVEGKYVTMNVHGTAQCKYWNHIGGWDIIVDYLNSKGYEVISLDKYKEYGRADLGLLNSIPNNTIDKTGDRAIEERVFDMSQAEFHIGTGSGLSWLAWGTGIPILLVSNFSKPFTEMSENCIRVYNDEPTSGYWNDINYLFDRGNWVWNPYKELNSFQEWHDYETITPDQVCSAVDVMIEKIERGDFNGHRNNRFGKNN